MLTLDSLDYIDASGAVLKHFALQPLGYADWRLPMYPLFLAVLRLVAAFSSEGVLIAQTALGIGCIVAGIAIGYVLDSPLAMVSLATLFAFDPVYLLNEHLLMSEALFLLMLVTLSVVGMICLRGNAGHRFGWFILLGLVLGFCLLTRGNALLFGGSFVLLVVLFVRGGRSAIHIPLFVGGALLGASLVVAPWLARNHALFGRLGLVNNGERNALLYLSEHGLIDVSLPLMHLAVGPHLPGKPDSPDKPDPMYDLIWTFGLDPGHAEAQAGALVREQMLAHPARYASEVIKAALHFLGFPVGGRFGPDDDLRFFRDLVGHVGWANHTLPADELRRRPEFTYSQVGRDTWLTHAWSRTGIAFLRVGRPVLFGLFALCLAIHLIRWRLSIGTLGNAAIIVMAASYLATILLHAVALADYDRFATVFDWIPLLVVSLIVGRPSSRAA